MHERGSVRDEFDATVFGPARLWPSWLRVRCLAGLTTLLAFHHRRRFLRSIDAHLPRALERLAALVTFLVLAYEVAFRCIGYRLAGEIVARFAAEGWRLCSGADR